MNADVEKAVEALRSNSSVPTDDYVLIEKALRDQDAEIVRLRGVADLIPASWLDPMLSGPSAVLKGYDYKGPDIERLLNAIRARITAHLGGEQ